MHNISIRNGSSCHTKFKHTYVHKSELRVNHEDSISILNKSNGRSPLNYSLQPFVDKIVILIPASDTSPNGFLPFTCWAFPSELVLFSLLLIRIAFLSDFLFPQPFVDSPKQSYSLYHYSSTSLHYHPFGDNNLLSFVLTLTLLVSVIFTTACSPSSFWW